MSETVADELIRALEQVGVTPIFDLIADSLNPITHAVRHSNIEWISYKVDQRQSLPDWFFPMTCLFEAPSQQRTRRHAPWRSPFGP